MSAAPRAVHWPSGAHLFHYPARAPWRAPHIDDDALRKAQGRGSAAPDDPTTRQLDVADRAFANAVLHEVKRAGKPLRLGLWRTARDAYAKASKTAGDAHPLGAYSQYRLTRALWNLGEVDEALKTLLGLLRTFDTKSSLPGAAVVRQRALRDVVALYAESSDSPEQSHRRLSAAADAPATVVKLEENLSEHYLELGRYDDARAVLDRLAERQVARRCVHGARAVAISIVENPGDVGGLLDRIRHQLTLQKQSQGKTKEARACRDATVVSIVELASAWHTEAVGWNGIRGSRDGRTLDGVATLLRLLDERFSPEALEAVRFGGLPEANRPTRIRIRLALAELERRQWKVESCGPSFLLAYEAANSPATRAAALEGAVHCYGHEVQDRSRRAHAKKGIVPIGETEKQFLELSKRNLCEVALDSADPLAYDRRLDFEVGRGRVYYLAHHWEQAVASLERLAFETGHPQAREAAAMYLVSLHRLHEKSSRASCQNRLLADKPKLVEMHCSNADEDDAELAHLAVSGVTAPAGRTRLSPCEALSAVGTPPLPLPEPPPHDRPPRPRFDSVSVSGNAIPEHVSWVVGLHAGQIERCYTAALRRNPYLEGEHATSIVVARDGSVSDAATRSTTHGDGELSECIRRVLLKIRFVPPEGGTIRIDQALRLSRTRGAWFPAQARIRQ